MFEQPPEKATMKLFQYRPVLDAGTLPRFFINGLIVGAVLGALMGLAMGTWAEYLLKAILAGAIAWPIVKSLLWLARWCTRKIMDPEDRRAHLWSRLRAQTMFVEWVSSTGAYLVTYRGIRAVDGGAGEGALIGAGVGGVAWMLWGVFYSRRKKKGIGSRCPHCGRQLATDQAKQCFRCGIDWHNPDQLAHSS
jgi:hypothetical protein